MDFTASRTISQRVERAGQLLENCRLCPRMCGVNRRKGERGFCGLTDRVFYFRDVLNFNEERELVPSHQIHFTGCNLRCEYCMVGEWNNEPEAGERLDVEYLAGSIRRRRDQGAVTLNLLGGEPGVNLHGVLELLSRVDADVRVVWNSNMYFNPVVDELLEGVVDVYLADFKCGCRRCAQEILGAKDYVQVVKESLKRVVGKAGLIIRHVLLPGHGECCFEPMMRWIAHELPGVKVSLKSDYLPPAGACRSPVEYMGEAEYRSSVSLAEKMGVNLIS